MTTLEWLRRLNLEKYADRFAKVCAYFVSDLRHYKDDPA